MCLSTVDKEPKVRQSGIGYKLVERRKDGYYCWDYREMAGKIKYPLGEWLTDPNHTPISIYGGDTYPAGFHVYLKLSDRTTSKYPRQDYQGKDVVIVKCQFSRVVATGTDWGEDVVIARRIKVLEEVYQ